MMEQGKRQFRGWEIEGVGGFCTIRHFVCTKNNQWFWRFKLKEAKETINVLEDNRLALNELSPIYLKSLYI